MSDVVKLANSDPIVVDDESTWKKDTSRIADPANQTWRCFAYERVSTPSQIVIKESDRRMDGASLADKADINEQTRLLDMFFASHPNFKYIGENKPGQNHYPFDVASGYLMENRKEWAAIYGKLVTMVEESHPTDLALIVCFKERISRSEKYEWIIERLRELHVQFFVVGTGEPEAKIDFSMAPSARIANHVITYIDSAQGSGDIDQKVERARAHTDVWIANKRAYFGGIIRYGYKLNPAKYRGHNNDKRRNLVWDSSIAWHDYVPEPTEAFVVRSIFRMASRKGEAMGVLNIAKFLCSHAVVPTGQKDADGQDIFQFVPSDSAHCVMHKTHGQPDKRAAFDACFVSTILKSPEYWSGHMTWRKLNSVLHLKHVKYYMEDNQIPKEDRTKEEKIKLLYDAKNSVLPDLRPDRKILDDDGEEVEVYPPLITKEEFDAAQSDYLPENPSDRLRARARLISQAKARPHVQARSDGMGILSGLLYCPVCGSRYGCGAMAKEGISKRTGKTIHYTGNYRDQGYRKGLTDSKGNLLRCCNQQSISYKLDDIVFDAVFSALSQGDARKALEAASEKPTMTVKTVKMIEARNKEIEKTKKDLYLDIAAAQKSELRFKGKSNAEAIEVYEKQIDDAQDKIEKLTEEQARNADLLKSKNEAGSASAWFDELDKALAEAKVLTMPIDKRQFLHMTVDRIEFYRPHIDDGGKIKSAEDLALVRIWLSFNKYVDAKTAADIALRVSDDYRMAYPDLDELMKRKVKDKKKGGKGGKGGSGKGPTLGEGPIDVRNLIDGYVSDVNGKKEMKSHKSMLGAPLIALLRASSISLPRASATTM
jgi:hypothetical protein